MRKPHTISKEDTAYDCLFGMRDPRNRVSLCVRRDFIFLLDMSDEIPYSDGMSTQRKLTQYAAGLALAAVACWFTLLAVQANSDHARLGRIEMRLASVKACVSNDAYQGRTPADTHELFFQCMGDYLDSVTDR